MLVVLVALAALVLHFVKPTFVTPVIIQRAQLFLFPLVLALLWTSRWFGIRLPHLGLSLAAIGCVTATALAYHLNRDVSGRQVVVARLSDDRDESETRLFGSALMEAAYTNNPVDVSRFYKSFSKDSEVRKLFSERPELTGVLWGTSRWMNLSLPDKAPLQLSSVRAFRGSTRLEKLSLVTSISILGLSDPTSRGTRMFLREVMNAGDNELLLLKSATVQDHWSSLAHRAYPLWKVATNYVIEYLEGGETNPGLLKCADTIFNTAYGYLRWGDNPNLQAAILNNRAVATALMAEHRGEEKGLTTAKEMLKAAMATRHQPNRYRVKYRAMRVAGENFHALRFGAVKAKKSGKNKKKVKAKKK